MRNARSTVKKSRKLKKILISAFGVLVVFFGIYLSIEPLYTPTALLSPHVRLPRYIAHKAIISKKQHEATTGNTIEAIQEALGSLVDGIELDVRLSKDHVPFLYHGDTLEEATNGHGKPEGYTWEELKRFSYTNPQESRLVSLEEVLQYVGSQKFLFLDIKSPHILNSDFAKKIVKLVHKYHLQETIIIESFNPMFLIFMRLEARDVLLMYNFTTNTVAYGEELQTQFDQIPWLLKQPFSQKQMRRIIRPDFLGPRWNFDETLIKSFVKRGYPIVSWTVDDPKVAEHLFSIGVTGIQSNEPVRLMRSLPEPNSHKVYDAGGTVEEIAKIIYVDSPTKVIAAIQEARQKHLHITIAGRRHSMGGQTLLDQSIHLDMLPLSHVTYNPKTHVVTVGAGATWKKVQNILDPLGRSVKVMQSDNVFTVGGSLSVNAHGWQVGYPPISSTVLKLKVITADGKIRTLS